MATINICDICGCRENVNRRQYEYDRQSDGVGGREDVCAVFDLCEKHELIVLKATITATLKVGVTAVTNNYIFNGLVIERIKNMIKRK